MYDNLKLGVICYFYALSIKIAQGFKLENVKNQGGKYRTKGHEQVKEFKRVFHTKMSLKLNFDTFCSSIILQKKGLYRVHMSIQLIIRYITALWQKHQKNLLLNYAAVQCCNLT